MKIMIHLMTSSPTRVETPKIPDGFVIDRETAREILTLMIEMMLRNY